MNNKESYIDAMKRLVKITKRPPLSSEQKKVVVELLKAHPYIKITPATEEEIGAVINYLNNVPDKSDIKIGIRRYKDVIFAPTFEDKSKYFVLEKDYDEQLIDFVDRLQEDCENDELGLTNMTNIYKIKG